jgi:hypothetical protein
MYLLKEALGWGGGMHVCACVCGGGGEIINHTLHSNKNTLSRTNMSGSPVDRYINQYGLSFSFSVSLALSHLNSCHQYRYCVTTEYEICKAELCHCLSKLGSVCCILKTLTSA